MREDCPGLEAAGMRAGRLHACGQRHGCRVCRIGGGVVKCLVDRCVGRRLADWLRARAMTLLKLARLVPTRGIKRDSNGPRPKAECWWLSTPTSESLCR